MKAAISILILSTMLCATSCAQVNTNNDQPTAISLSRTSYEEWKEAAQADIRLSPKFSGASKSDAQKEADHALIEEYVKEQGSREKGSEVLVEIGFNYLYKGDLKTAMFRFNQAWLLNPKNENAFWGFASVYFTLGDLNYAMEELKEGLTINLNRPIPRQLIKAANYNIDFYPITKSWRQNINRY